MKTYQVYIKSHSEAPDFEAEFTEEELKGVNYKCQIPYADDIDEEGQAVGGKCGGELIKTKEGYKCKSCSQEYVEN